MIGPSVLCQTLTLPVSSDRRFPNNRWQYHSRSDRHSRITCWGLAVDLLTSSQLLREMVRSGELGFAVHHTMQDFKNYRKKSLDLVICRPAGPPTGRTLVDLQHQWGLQLTEPQLQVLEDLPSMLELPVGEVLIAMEAKACMTAHQKARPRLYDELNSSHLTIHGASDSAIAVGNVLINTADRFISTDRNKWDMTSHDPLWSDHKASWPIEVVQKMMQLPRRSGTGQVGFDALSLVGIRCTNSGSEQVTLDSSAPLPRKEDPYHYDRMVQRVATLLASRFPML